MEVQLVFILKKNNFTVIIYSNNCVENEISPIKHA